MRGAGGMKIAMAENDNTDPTGPPSKGSTVLKVITRVWIPKAAPLGPVDARFAHRHDSRWRQLAAVLLVSWIPVVAFVRVPGRYVLPLFGGQALEVGNNFPPSIVKVFQNPNVIQLD